VPTALYWGAIIAGASGNVAVATAYANRALRLSPFDPVAFCAHSALGYVAVLGESYDDAISHFATAVQANPRLSTLYFIHAAALALAGRVAEAKLIAGQGLELEPNVRIGELFDHALFHRGLMHMLMEGTRLLDLPE
jgi:adenylate cyclase